MPLRFIRLKGCAVSAGITVTVLRALELPNVAVMVAVKRALSEGVPVVVMLNVAIVDRTGTVVVDGTITRVSLLTRLTTLAPGSAAEVSVTVPVADLPGAIVAGLIVTLCTVGGGMPLPVTVSIAPLPPVKVTVPLEFPACVGLNLTVTVWVC